MEVYLDNSATTRCSKAATDKMVELLTMDFGKQKTMRRLQNLKIEKLRFSHIHR